MRIVALSVVALAGLLGAVYLLAQPYPVPTEYWALCMVCVLGLAGVESADYIANIISRRKE